MKKAVSIVLLLALITMSTPALAAENDFVPSVTAKPAPEIVPPDIANYPKAIALIFNDKDEIIAEIPTGWIVVTPLAKIESAPTEEIKENLQAAYEEILSAKSLADLNGALKAQIQASDSSLTMKDIVVRDLFDVSVFGTYVDYLKTKGNYIQVRFALGISADAPVWVMTRDSGGWNSIDPQYVVNNNDGSVTIRFYHLCPVAIMTKASVVTATDSASVQSPQTGYPENTLPFEGLAIAFGALAIVFFLTGSAKRITRH